MNPDPGRRSRVSVTFAVGVAMLFGALGCSSGKDRAPPVSDCAELRCGADSGNGGAPFSTGGRTGATGGSANSTGGRGTSGAGGGQAMSGNVRIYADGAFEATKQLSGAGVVGLTGAVRVTGTFEAGQWSVSGAEAGTLWADMHATVMGQDAFDTLQVLDGAGAELVFASRSALDTIVTGLSAVQSINPDFAQIVLKFVNAARQPVAGVVVAQPTATIAYDAGSSYTDTKGAPFGATQGRGMAIIVNYPAPPFPGDAITIQYVKPGAASATPVDLRAAVGAVSLRTVVVN